MDILTQGLLGGVLAQAIAKPEHTRKASWIGFISGLLADADVFIRSTTDPLLMLEFHRHFSHSIFFIPLGALIAALLLYYFFKSQLTFRQTYLYAFAGYSLSGAIDACTSYGTYLFWPIIDERVSLNIISIVDPVFTLALLIAFVVAIFRLRPRPTSVMGLSFCLAYLAFALIQQGRAEMQIQQLAKSRQHSIEKMLVKPTLGNLILWRSTYIADGQIYADGVRMGITGKPRIIQGASIAVFDAQRDMPEFRKDSVLYRDIQRFTKLSDGYVALKLGSRLIVGDVRYSMLPTSVEPLWGIVFDPLKHDQHVAYETFRNNGKQLRQDFSSMLLGE